MASKIWALRLSDEDKAHLHLLVKQANQANQANQAKPKKKVTASAIIRKLIRQAAQEVDSSPFDNMS